MSPDRKIIYLEEDVEHATPVAVLPILLDAKNKPLGIFLGVRKEDGCLSPIGGRLENKESLESGLEREWYEETGTDFGLYLDLIPGKIKVMSLDDPSREGHLFWAKIKNETSLTKLREVPNLMFMDLKDLEVLLESGSLHGHSLFRPEVNIINLGQLLEIWQITSGTQTPE